MSSSTINSVFNLPDISFTDNDTLDAMMNRMIANYESRYKEVTGKSISLSAADPMRIALYAAALELFQTEQYVDRAGKQDLLKYSYGDFLDNLAGNRSVIRQQASAARTTLRFTISETKDYAIGIPAGTRATNGDGVYFETVEYGEIGAGSLYVDIDAVCTADGIEGNDFVPGQINILVDTVAYVQRVSNVTTTSGGTDLEDDDSLAERVFLAPSSYSAGTYDSYVYRAKTFNTGIGSVRPTSPNPCEVVIYILMTDGRLPEEEVVQGLQEYLMETQDQRAMTDYITVKAPDSKPFSINLTYYINKSDSASALTIQTEVEAAVNDYVKWQTTEIGKDINPSELIMRVKTAGAKRVEVTSPVFEKVTDTEVAQIADFTVNYGGLEDD